MIYAVINSEAQMLTSEGIRFRGRQVLKRIYDYHKRAEENGALNYIEGFWNCKYHGSLAAYLDDRRGILSQ